MQKHSVAACLFGLCLLAPVASSQAMDLGSAPRTDSAVYKPSRDVVKKAMEKMGIKYTVDKDGDLKFHVTKDDEEMVAYVVYNTLSKNDGVWNLQLIAEFATKPERYRDLTAYCNDWNKNKRFPKIFMRDEESLRLEMNIPIEYGFNPDEFQHNGMGLFTTTLKQIAEEIDDMRN